MRFLTRGEIGACPRQLSAVMEAQRQHRTRWRTDTWSWLQIQRDAIRNWISVTRDRLCARGWNVDRGRFYGGTYWPAGFAKPRTCSYCGGVHPEDAIDLLLAGWEVEGTSKSYKRYLHPPGHAAHVMGPIAGTESYVRSPVPPVKVYTYHFDDRQIAQFNAALDEQLEEGMRAHG